jgi:hypothetical protein
MPSKEQDVGAFDEGAMKPKGLFVAFSPPFPHRFCLEKDSFLAYSLACQWLMQSPRRPRGTPRGCPFMRLFTPRSKFAYLIDEFNRFGKIGLRVIPF